MNYNPNQRIGEIDIILASKPYDVVDAYESMDENQYFKVLERLNKEYNIAYRLGKEMKPIKDAIYILELVMEKKSLEQLIRESEKHNEGHIIG